MACEKEIHLGDIGTEFVVEIVECTGEDANGDPIYTAVDVSTNTSLNIYFKKPDGTVLTKTAGFASVDSGATNDGTDGKISYYSVAGDLDVLGKWYIQGKVTLPSGAWSSAIGSFKVKSNIF